MTVLYKQRNKSDCGLMCIAMAVQKEPESIWMPDVWDKVLTDGGIFGEAIDLRFTQAGLDRNRDYTVANHIGYSNPHLVRQMLKGRRAMLQVVSLNYHKTEHLIYWDGHNVLDPSPLSRYQWIEQVNPSYMWLIAEKS